MLENQWVGAAAVSKDFTHAQPGGGPAVLGSGAMSNPEKEALSFDAALTQLQQVVKSLEGGELSLEESLKAFEKGVALSRACQAQLTAADQKVELLVRGADTGAAVELAAFGGSADESRKTKT